MKIAFEKKLPNPESYLQLVHECKSENNGGTEADSYEQLKQYSNQVVAAYDGDLLVAVGGLRLGGAQDTEFGGEWSATIRSGYAKRNLETNMKKLLSQHECL